MSGPESSPVVGVLHTAPALCAEVNQIAKEQHIGARLLHIVDEGLLWTAMAEGTSDRLVQRVALQCSLAVASGAQAVLVSCSSLGSAVEQLRRQSPVPLLRIDEPMARQAVELGTRIGALATISSTLEPTAQLVERTARQAGKDVTVLSRLCQGAFEALRAGSTSEHDAAVLRALDELAPQVDVVVLAQASMSRVLDARDARPGDPPVLSSPQGGVAQLSALGLSGQAQADGELGVKP